MKILLLMKHNIYHGREYMAALLEANIAFDVVSFGQSPDDYPPEDERCNHGWKPKPFKEMIDRCVNHYNFSSLSEKTFQQLLDEKQYDLGIQGGGLGILKEDVFNKFKLGILNFHPGDLPEYRGCSSPEWQLVDGKKVIATCHLVASKIDSGDILSKKELDLDYSDYYAMRSSIYPEIAKYLVEVIKEIIKDGGINHLTKQDEDIAVYRDYIGQEAVGQLKENMFNGANFSNELRAR